MGLGLGLGLVLEGVAQMDDVVDGHADCHGEADEGDLVRVRVRVRVRVGVRVRDRVRVRVRRGG